jgi:ABC-type bacteriocin/lantibiotic exporter with double-glycine peptidase domain
LVIRTDNHQIIGITGLSGKGKSTIVKLMLKLYALKEGKIYIDDCDIQEVDPDYIRQNITYVNQTGKLFDRKIIENLMYGCGHNEKCQSHLKEIMERPKIKELFKDMDIFEKSSGALGENLSGGQRQVVNIIGGIINPSKILVLVEPTNALDGGLKQEIIQLIKDYKKEKHAIIVITHDRDLFPVLDEKIEI